jgi:16S rRNA (uracil1498-N3)-methyltransferase
MKRLILDQELKADNPRLTPEDSHYLTNVLRMSPGDKFILVDPKGLEHRVLLVSVKKQGALFQIEEQLLPSRVEAGVSVDLWLPLLKGEKVEIVLQKAVELGVASITLWSAKRSVVRPAGNEEKKFTRWQAIAKNAAQQCGRTKVPKIRGVMDLKDVPREGTRIFAWELERALPLKSALAGSPQSITVLTGPEGGLDPVEAEFLHAAGFQSVTLGARILRAETAAITLLACTMFALGQLE